MQDLQGPDNPEVPEACPITVNRIQYQSSDPPGQGCKLWPTESRQMESHGQVGSGQSGKHLYLIIETAGPSSSQLLPHKDGPATARTP